MWYGSKYSMAVQAEMLCLFSRSLPPVLSCDRVSPDFQQWETSVEQLMLNALLTAWLSPKVKRGSPYHPTVMTELLVCFPSAFFFPPTVLKMQSSLGVSTATAFWHAFILFSRNTSFYISACFWFSYEKCRERQCSRYVGVGEKTELRYTTNNSSVLCPWCWKWDNYQ